MHPTVFSADAPHAFRAAVRLSNRITCNVRRLGVDKIIGTLNQIWPSAPISLLISSGFNSHIHPIFLLSLLSVTMSSFETHETDFQ